MDRTIKRRHNRHAITIRIETMYTSKDAIALIRARNLLHMNISILKAAYCSKSGISEREASHEMSLLQYYISVIDSLLPVLNYTEAFVIRSKLIEGMDWQQISIRYEQTWGIGGGRTIRAFQLRFRSGIAKIVGIMNRHSITTWDEILEAQSYWLLEHE